MTARSISRPATRNLSGSVLNSLFWTPLRLFQQGQQGVWYEPRPEYLYQDSAGTAPVTADGQPVGRMEDLSGNGNHATQDTASYKPLYRTDGVLHWLELDGLDDRLETPLTLDPDKSVGATRVRRDSDGDGYVFGSTNSPYAGQWMSSGSNTGQTLLTKGGHSSITDLAAWASGAWAVDLLAESGFVINEQGSQLSANFGSAARPTESFRIGMRPGSTATHAMSIAAIIISFDNDSLSAASQLHNHVSKL